MIYFGGEGTRFFVGRRNPAFFSSATGLTYNDSVVSFILISAGKHNHSEENAPFLPHCVQWA